MITMFAWDLVRRRNLKTKTVPKTSTTNDLNNCCTSETPCIVFSLVSDAGEDSLPSRTW